MPAMTLAEAHEFAGYLRCRLPYPPGHRDHALLAFTVYARRVLRRPALGHWRDLSRADASLVLQACRAEYPKLREPWDYPRGKS